MCFVLILYLLIAFLTRIEIFLVLGMMKFFQSKPRNFRLRLWVLFKSFKSSFITCLCQKRKDTTSLLPGENRSLGFQLSFF